jgi:hypothetical protein
MIASGWLALLPTLAVVAAAILLRSTLPALVVGVLVGHALLDGSGLVGGFAESLRRQVATPTGAWVLLVCGRGARPPSRRSSPAGSGRAAWRCSSPGWRGS